MKIKLWTKYNVGYLPTKRCRKLRYREEEEYIYVEVKEVIIDKLEPVFNDGNMIYSYDNKLWREATERNIHCGNPDNPMTALDALVYAGTTYSTYFGKYNGYCGDESTREQRDDVINRAKQDMNNYIIVDGKLYITTSEPMYCIYTFGLGYNHAGIGTSISINYFYNCNISKERYFNALEYDKAVKKALEIAEKRGDTDSFKHIKRSKPIIVYNKKFVTRNPQKEHINGNSFINSIETAINSSNNKEEAGLLAITMCLSEIENKN